VHMKTDSFIDGSWAGAERQLTVVDPATELPVAEVANASVADCLAAVRAADRAFASWRQTAPRQRGEILRRAFELMMARQRELAELISRENGKVLADALAEVAYAAEFFRWYGEEAVRIDGEYRRAPSGAYWILVTRQPVGVSLLITPWNFPAAMATRKIGPALAAGCTVVLKAAHETPLTALAVADVLAEAGVPAGVVNVVVPDPPGPAVQAMLESGLVRKLSFTGSTRVGAQLLAQAAPRIINCSMELGGNAPFIVFADADLDAAVDGAMLAKMRNAGAACTAANRFYVERGAVDAFTDRLAARMGALRVGPGLDPDSAVGALVSGAQRDRVAGLVDQLHDGGATMVVGGHRPDGRGFFYPPTVVRDVSPDSPVLREEIFGPVAPIVAFDDVDAMVGRANAVEHGLVSYVYSGDVGKAMRVAEALESGMVGLNRGLVSDPAAPFGGVKASGIGREGGHEGLLAFLEQKYVAGTW
jgi:succinate-semialdehyde dehydrogenase / glutarate-semialdehyde dehydrogenase